MLAVRRRHRHDAGKDVLRDVILGGQDGLVNILGIVLGVMAGGGDRTVLLSAGFAAAITESISMGAVGYTSTVADRDYYAAQRAVEEASLSDDPDMEREEVQDLYKSKGFSGPLLDQVVATITSNREKWLGTIMEEERHLEPVATEDIVRSSVVITLATLVGHLIPLAPFLFLPRSHGSGPGDRPECAGAFRGWRLLGHHPGRHLVEAGTEDDPHRLRCCRPRLSDRHLVPRWHQLTYCRPKGGRLRAIADLDQLGAPFECICLEVLTVDRGQTCELVPGDLPDRASREGRGAFISRETSHWDRTGRSRGRAH